MYTCVLKIYRVFHYQIDKLAGSVGGTDTNQNKLTMKVESIVSCELWSKEAEIKDRNNT